MTDSNKYDQPPSPATPAEAVPAPEIPVKAPPKTRGEVLFDAFDWYFIGAGANATVSLGLADRASFLNWKAPLNKLTAKVVKTWPFRTGDAAENSQYVQKFNDIAKAILERPEHAERAADIKWSTNTLEAAGTEAGEGFRGLFHRVGEGKVEDVLNFAKNHERLGAQFSECTAADMKRIMKAGFRYHNSMNKASSVAALMMLGSGGFFLMAPIKWLEDKKEPIVKWLDKTFGPSNPTEEQKKKVEERHEYLQHEPKQSWTSVLLSRVCTLPFVYTFHFNFGSRDNLINRAAYGLTGKKERTFEGLNHYFGKSGNYLYRKVQGKYPEELAEMEMNLGRKVEEYNEVLHAQASTGNKSAQRSIEGGFFTKEPTQQANGQARVQAFLTNLAPEAFYSTVVATGTYIASRYLAPIFGIKSDEQITLERLAKQKTIASSLEKCPLPLPANDEVIAEASTEIANKDIGGKLPFTPVPAKRNKPDGPGSRITAHQAMDVVVPREGDQLGVSA